MCRSALCGRGCLPENEKPELGVEHPYTAFPVAYRSDQQSEQIVPSDPSILLGAIRAKRSDGSDHVFRTPPVVSVADFGRQTTTAIQSDNDNVLLA